MADFTKDKWEVLPNGNDLDIKIGEEQRIYVVLQATDLDMDNYIARKANANLIASAPDLYYALEKAVNDYGKEGGPWNVPSEPGTWIDMAKNALKKARGG